MLCEMTRSACPSLHIEFFTSLFDNTTLAVPEMATLTMTGGSNSAHD